MNETLKGVAHIGAELAAAKADLQREMERHRKTWRQLEQVTGLLSDACAELKAWVDSFPNASHHQANALMARIKAALAQQAEPADEIPDFTPGSGNKARRRMAAISLADENQRVTPVEPLLAPPHPLAQQAEPAPAQDELLPCPFCGGEPNLTHGDYVRDDLSPMTVVECKSCSAWVRVEDWNRRPAQTEQQATVKDCLTVQPMAYAVFAANGNAVCFSTRRDHPSLVALKKEGHSVVSLAPIAQTAPQHDSDCSTNNRGVPDLLGPCDCSLSRDSQ